MIVVAVAAVFALALAENAIGSKAYKPHQIIKSLKVYENVIL